MSSDNVHKIFHKSTFSESTFTSYLVWTSEGWGVSEYSDLAEGDIYKSKDADPPSEELQRLSKEIRPLSCVELHKEYENFDSAVKMVEYMRQFDGVWVSHDNPLYRRVGWENDNCNYNVGMNLTTVQDQPIFWIRILRYPVSRIAFGIACQDKSIDFSNWEVPTKEA